MSEKLIAIDVGGTTARVGSAESAETVDELLDGAAQFEVANDYESDLAAFKETIRAQVGDSEATRIAFASAGTLDPETRTLRSVPNAKDWAGKPFIAELEKEFGCEVRWLNDADAGGLAEATYGEHGREDFWFVIWGTGVGGSFVSFPEGKGFRVDDEEPGHLPLRRDETSPRCGCGRYGCFEAYCGGGSIKQERFDRKPAAELTEEQWEDVCQWMGVGLYAMIRARAADCIVLGGGIANKQSDRLRAVEANANRELDGYRKISVDLATHGEDAGLVGALASLKRG